jgi:hypothetical protein
MGLDEWAEVVGAWNSVQHSIQSTEAVNCDAQKLLHRPNGLLLHLVARHAAYLAANPDHA